MARGLRKRKFSTCLTGRYNLIVFTLHTKPVNPGNSPKQRVRHREAAGVLIIALLILAITLVRYWHNIAWSAR